MASYGTLLPYLEAISLELPSCTFLTNDGGLFQVYTRTKIKKKLKTKRNAPSCTFKYLAHQRNCNCRCSPTCSPFSALSWPPSSSIFSACFFQVQSHMLSLLSPLLATLLAQAGPRPTISLPCSETLSRFIIYFSFCPKTPFLSSETSLLLLCKAKV